MKRNKTEIEEITDCLIKFIKVNEKKYPAEKAKNPAKKYSEL